MFKIHRSELASVALLQCINACAGSMSRLCVSVWECEIFLSQSLCQLCNCAIIICISAAHLLFTKTYSRQFHSRDLSHYGGEKSCCKLAV